VQWNGEPMRVAWPARVPVPPIHTAPAPPDQVSDTLGAFMARAIVLENAELFPLDKGHRHAQIGSKKRCGVTPGATAEHDKGTLHHRSSFQGLPGKALSKAISIAPALLL